MRKKIFLFVLFLTGCSGILMSQEFPFEIETEHDVAYQPLNDGTVLSEPGWGGDGITVGYEIPFPFQMPHFGIGDGVLRAGWTPDNGVELFFGPSEGEGFDIFVPYQTGLVDINNYDSEMNSLIRYKMEGVEGQRVLILEYFMAGFDNLEGASGATVNTTFQISFHEESGEITLHFGEQNNREIFHVLHERDGLGPIIYFSLNVSLQNNEPLPEVAALLSGEIDDPILVQFDSFEPPEEMEGLRGDPLEGTLYRFQPLPTNSIDYSPENSISVSPNPASTNIYLVSSETENFIESYALFSSTGEEVMSGVWSNNHQSISLNHLDRGIYILWLITPKGPATFRVVKMD